MEVILIGLVVFLLMLFIGAMASKGNSYKDRVIVNDNVNIIEIPIDGTPKPSLEPNASASFKSQDVSRLAMMTLESTRIIASSKAIDTVIGRYQNLKPLIEQLKNASNHPGYLTNIQRGVDIYKSAYYDLIIQDYQLQLITDPIGFDLEGFYAQSLGFCMTEYANKEIEVINVLKRKDAIVRHLKILMEKTELGKQEMISECKSVHNYESCIASIQKLIELINGELVRAENMQPK